MEGAKVSGDYIKDQSNGLLLEMKRQGTGMVEGAKVSGEGVLKDTIKASEDLLLNLR